MSNGTFISSVRWRNDRNFADPKYRRISQTALWHFIKPDPASFDPHFRNVRDFYSLRKPWKIVTPWFMQNVMDWWFVEVEWDGKPVEGYRDEVRLRSRRSELLTYDQAMLTSYVSHSNDWLHRKIGEYDVSFMHPRKPWKRITKAHAKLVIHNLGGKAV